MAKEDYDANMPVTPFMRSDLTWWIDNVDNVEKTGQANTTPEPFQ